jgi:hypothetical protein
MGKRIAILYAAEDISEDDLEEFTETMDRLMKFIFVGVKQETLDKLTDTQQMEIIGAFTKLLTAGLPEGAIEAAQEKLQEQIEAEKMRATAKRNKGEPPQKKTAKNMNS